MPERKRFFSIEVFPKCERWLRAQNYQLLQVVCIGGERRQTRAGEEKANRKKIMNQYSPQSPELWDLAGPLRET